MLITTPKPQFQVSRLHGFIQIGLGIAIGIDCLTTEHRTNGKARLCFRLFSAVRGASVALPWRYVIPHREGAKLGVWRLAKRREGQVSLVRAALCAAKAVHRATVHAHV